MADRLTNDDIACWVIKSRTAPKAILTDWARGETRSLSRCLRRSYRVELMAPGQLCLLWLSGAEQPGVQAIGAVDSEATVSPDTEPTPRELAVAVSLLHLEQPVPRGALLADHVFAAAEVLRMPAGSNPSYLSKDQLGALLELLSPSDLQRADWPQGRVT